MLKKKLKVEFQNYVGLLVLFFGMMVIFAVVGAKAIAAISLLAFYATAIIYPMRWTFLGLRLIHKAHKVREAHYALWKKQALAWLEENKTKPQQKQNVNCIFADPNNKEQMNVLIGAYGEDYLYRQGVLKRKPIKERK